MIFTGVEKKVKLFPFVFIFLSLFFISLVGAVSNLDIPLPTSLADSYGSFRLNENMELIQICTNETATCDGCNITSLRYPNGSAIIGSVTMNKTGSFFNYTLNGSYTNIIGKYAVTGVCVGGGTYSPWAYTFEITPTGFSNLLGFYFIIIGISLIILVLGFWVKDPWVVIFGTFGLFFVGLYILLNGIDGIRNLAYTRAIAFIIIGLAAYISIKAGISIGND